MRSAGGREAKFVWIVVFVGAMEIWLGASVSDACVAIVAAIGQRR